MADEIISRSEAKARGLTRYFTGKPCKRGHIAGRRVANYGCEICVNLEEKYRRERNIQKFRKKDHDRYWNNHQSELERGRKFREENREKLKLKARRRKAKKPDHVLRLNRESMRRRRARGIAQKELKEWLAKNPGKRQEYNNKYRARKIAVGGSFSVEDIVNIRKQQNNKCAYCRINFGKKIKATIDHIKALSKGGSNNACNIQLLCVSCNTSKNARDPLEFARDNGLLL
jgi:5-methylcytosine-specific restriction endonuclease McrA